MQYRTIPLAIVASFATVVPGAGADGEPTDEAWTGELVNHHVHVFSAPVRSHLEAELDLDPLPDLGVEQLLASMDQENVDKAALLSNGYFFTGEGENTETARGKRRTENDRIANAAAEHSDRIVGFFSVNPLAENALEVISRNAERPQRSGLKLHFANSEVDLTNSTHVARLQKVFELAAEYDLPAVVHMRTRGEGYGREDARVFVEQVLYRVEGLPVQVAHMAGWSGYDQPTHEALGVFAEAIDRGRLPNVYFDISAVVKGPAKTGKERSEGFTANQYRHLVNRLRTIGMDRILFGTDWPEWQPWDYVADLKRDLPLKPDELHTILTNRAPWME